MAARDGEREFLASGLGAFVDIARLQGRLLRCRRRAGRPKHARGTAIDDDRRRFPLGAGGQQIACALDVQLFIRAVGDAGHEQATGEMKDVCDRGQGRAQGGAVEHIA